MDIILSTTEKNLWGKSESGLRVRQAVRSSGPISHKPSEDFFLKLYKTRPYLGGIRPANF